GQVMARRTGDPKITASATPKTPAPPLPAAGGFFGPPSYMPPEQALGAAVDGRSDIFSLGSVTYLMLTGLKAFDAPSVPAVLNRVARNDPPPPSQFVPSLPAAVDQIVMRALAKRPSDRYADGRAMAEDIEDALADRPLRHGLTRPPDWAGPATAPLGAPDRRSLTPSPPAAPRRTSTWGRREVMVLAGLAVAAALTLLVVSPRPI